MFVVAVYGNVPIRKADNLNECVELVETALYRAPQLNGSWIKFPCLNEKCNVHLIMEFYPGEDPSYGLFHEGDFHWCTYTPNPEYQILGRNAFNEDDKFKMCKDIIKQLRGDGVQSNWTMIRLTSKPYMQEIDLKDLLIKGALIESTQSKKALGWK